jgi:hypothetical protein
MYDDTSAAAPGKQESIEKAANWNAELCVSKYPCTSLDDQAIVRGSENQD